MLHRPGTECINGRHVLKSNTELCCQVVMAAAAAAGLNRNGIRRTAFSTGDLQALSVLPAKSSPSPPDPANVSLHRYSIISLYAVHLTGKNRYTAATFYCKCLLSNPARMASGYNDMLVMAAR